MRNDHRWLGKRLVQRNQRSIVLRYIRWDNGLCCQGYTENRSKTGHQSYIATKLRNMQCARLHIEKLAVNVTLETDRETSWDGYDCGKSTFHTDRETRLKYIKCCIANWLRNGLKYTRLCQGMLEQLQFAQAAWPRDTPFLPVIYFEQVLNIINELLKFRILTFSRNI